MIDSVCELVLDMKTRHQAAKEDEVKLTTYFSETFPQYIAYAENFIKASSSGWCVGSKISQADITLFHFLTAYFDASVDIATKLPPGVATLVGKVGANPGIAKWVAGRATRGDIF